MVRTSWVSADRLFPPPVVSPPPRRLPHRRVRSSAAQHAQRPLRWTSPELPATLPPSSHCGRHATALPSAPSAFRVAPRDPGAAARVPSTERALRSLTLLPALR